MDAGSRTRNRQVLVVGAYLADRESRIRAVVDELGRSEQWEVQQRWIAIGGPPPADLALHTAEVARTTEPKKFAFMNRLLAGVNPSRFAYVLVCDDDIGLPARFVDDYLALVETYDFALAQPARTYGSFTDHHFVTQLQGIRARRTRFVEIGPLFSIRTDAVPLLVPFDESSPMGWGYDFVWPVVLEEARLRMGIVDATPMAHDLRKPAAAYDGAAMRSSMRSFLATRAHLPPEEAFEIVESYP